MVLVLLNCVFKVGMLFYVDFVLVLWVLFTVDVQAFLSLFVGFVLQNDLGLKYKRKVKYEW